MSEILWVIGMTLVALLLAPIFIAGCYFALRDLIDLCRETFSEEPLKELNWSATWTA